MALPATYSFDGGTSGVLTTVNTNFSAVHNQIYEQASSFYGTNYGLAYTSSQLCAARWNVDTPDNDQYSKVIVSNLPNTLQQGAGVRMSSSASTYYYYMVCNAGGGNDRLGKVIAGSNTNLATISSSYAVNSDVVYVKAEGTTITPNLNGSTTNTPGAQTDSAITSGYVGMMGQGAGSPDGGSMVHIDDWEGGNLASGTSLTVADAFVTTQTDAVTLTKTDTLTVNDAFVTTQADNVVLTLSTLTLTVQNTFVTTQVDTATLTKSDTLTVNDSFVTTQADNATLTKSDTLTVADAFVTTQADNVTLTKSDNLTVQNTFVTTQTDALDLTYILHYNPDSDTLVGSWTNEVGATSNLYQSVDERITANDSDYIQSDVSPSSSPVVVALPASISDPLTSGDHVLAYRYALDGSGTINLVVELRQGYVNEGSQGTLIAQWTHNSIGSIATAEQTLSGAQADAITNYSSLFVRMVANEV